MTLVLQIDDLPAGDYEIVAMFDEEEDEQYQQSGNGGRRPRLANYRNNQNRKCSQFIFYVRQHKNLLQIINSKKYFRSE